MAVYFLTPFGYVFAGLFLLVSGIVFTVYNLAGGKSDMYGMLGVLNFVSIVIFPVLTMKLLAEEKKTGTDQLLFTASVTTAAIVLGKYLAAFFVFVATLALTGVFALFLIFFGRASVGGIIGSYLGFILLGSAYIAICLLASSLTENQVTAAMAGFGFLFGLMLIGLVANVIPIPLVKTVVQWLAILTKYQEFTNGLLKTGPFVYYLSFTIAFLIFTIRVVTKRQQSREC
jgi:ABC-2 type transport system permease protein